MARGRMIDQGFTRSDKLNSIPRDARLVYASILPILDREGRTCAEPLVLKVNVFRRSDFTVEEIVEAVAQLAAVGLIRLYADKDNEAILEYVRFLDFNSPNSRERASEYPGPDDEGAQPLRDPDLLTALEAHDTPTDTPRATHVQGQCGDDAAPVQGERGVQGNVNGTGTLTGTINENGTRAQDARPASRKPRTQTKKRPPSFDPLQVHLPEFVSHDAWTDFVEHRRLLKKPLTKRAAELIFKELAKTPLEADAMLRRSVANGWTGVYARDDNRPGKESSDSTALDQYKKRGL